MIRDQASSIPVGRPRVTEHSGPRIEVVHEGEMVKYVTVVCSCGETITLECSYAAQETSQPATNAET